MAQLLWTAKTEKTVPTSQRQRVCVFGLPFRSRVVGRLSENSTFPGFDSLRDGANIEIPSIDRLTASVDAGSAPLQLRRHERQLGKKGSLIVNVGQSVRHRNVLRSNRTSGTAFQRKPAQFHFSTCQRTRWRLLNTAALPRTFPADER